LSKSPDHKKLDNPVWFSVIEKHRDFSVDYSTIKFYHPDYCPFGGFETSKEISGPIDQYSKLTNSFYIVGEKPVFSNQLKLNNELVCLQMVIENKINIDIKEDISALTNEHSDALFQLVNLVQRDISERKLLCSAITSGSLEMKSWFLLPGNE